LPLNCDDDHGLLKVVDPDKCLRENIDVVGDMATIGRNEQLIV